MGPMARAIMKCSTESPQTVLGVANGHTRAVRGITDLTPRPAPSLTTDLTEQGHCGGHGIWVRWDPGVLSMAPLVCWAGVFPRKALC